MREIKFRIWVKSHGCYLSEVMIEQVLLCEIDSNTWIVEQFTGLLDKNGKEIYEGDIVSQIFDNEEPCPCTIIFENGSCRKKYADWDDTLSKPIIDNADIYCLNLTVIGNIHENPELLK